MINEALPTHEADGPAEEVDRPETQRVGRNLAALGAGQLFTWTMTLAWMLVVPRLLGPRGLGMIVTGIAVAGILQVVLGAGTGVYLARELVVRPQRSGRLVGTAMIARLILAPWFMAAIVVWAQLAHYSADGTLVLYLSGGATVLYLLAEPVQSFFQAIERMHYRAIGDAINKAAQGLGGIVLTLAGFGALGFAGCWLVMSGVVLVLSLRWARRYFRVDYRTTRRELMSVARGSAAYWTSGAFGMVYLWIDTAMLSVMTNPTVVGWYGVPTRLFTTMLFAPVLFATAWFPRLVRAAQRSQHELHAASRTPVALILSLSVPIAAVIAVSAPEMIRLVYGPKYAPAGTVLILLGLCVIPMYLNIMLYQVCAAENRQARWTWLMIGACVVNPAINAMLIPLTQHTWHNGAVGAALALLLTETAIACGGIAIAGRRVLGLSTLDRLARVVLASGGMWLAVYVTRGVGAIASLAAGGLALVTLLWMSGAVTRDERRGLQKWLRTRTANVKMPLTGLRRRRDAPEPAMSVPAASVAARAERAASAVGADPADGRGSVESVELAGSGMRRKWVAAEDRGDQVAPAVERRTISEAATARN